MGSEILDSSGGTRSVAPGPAVDSLPDATAPLVELDELAPVQIDPPPSAPSRGARPLAAARYTPAGRARGAGPGQHRPATVRTVPRGPAARRRPSPLG